MAETKHQKNHNYPQINGADSSQKKKHKWTINFIKMVNIFSHLWNAIKGTLIFLLAPIKVSITKKKNNHKCWDNVGK